MSEFERERETELNFDSGLAFSYDWDFGDSPRYAPVAANSNVENPEEDVEDSAALSLDELKEKLSPQLVPLHQLKPPAGLETGVDVIDDFLLWRGFPKGDLTLLSGAPGTGATSLWLQTAARVQAQKKWVAWVNSDWELLPSSLVHKHLNLQKLLVVRKPAENSQLFWILQEMISSSLFEMIGCHLAEDSLKNHQLHKLKKLARTHQVAGVFIS